MRGRQGTGQAPPEPIESNASERLKAVFSDAHEEASVSEARAAFFMGLKRELDPAAERVAPDVLQDTLAKGGPSLAETLLQNPGIEAALARFENAVSAIFEDSASGGPKAKRTGLGKIL
ncbi:Uncharacterised protein [Candidatus Burarchaeum australiense]|nr:Uncharacterised protein [Candidatus Burarchaeum australiense]